METTACIDRSSLSCVAAALRESQCTQTQACFYAAAVALPPALSKHLLAAWFSSDHLTPCPPPLPPLMRATSPVQCCALMPAGLDAFPALIEGESTESRTARRQAYHTCWGSLSAHIDVRPSDCMKGACHCHNTCRRAEEAASLAHLHGSGAPRMLTMQRNASQAPHLTDVLRLKQQQTLVAMFCVTTSHSDLRSMPLPSCCQRDFPMLFPAIICFFNARRRRWRLPMRRSSDSSLPLLASDMPRAGQHPQRTVCTVGPTCGVLLAIMRGIGCWCPSVWGGPG